MWPTRILHQVPEHGCEEDQPSATDKSADYPVSQRCLRSWAILLPLYSPVPELAVLLVDVLLNQMLINLPCCIRRWIPACILDMVNHSRAV
jgi:hypothetical protein